MKSAQNNLGWHDCGEGTARHFNECIATARLVATKGKGHETRPIQFVLRKRRKKTFPAVYYQCAEQTATDTKIVLTKPIKM